MRVADRQLSEQLLRLARLEAACVDAGGVPPGYLSLDRLAGLARERWRDLHWAFQQAPYTLPHEFNAELESHLRQWVREGRKQGEDRRERADRLRLLARNPESLDGLRIWLVSELVPLLLLGLDEVGEEFSPEHPAGSLQELIGAREGEDPERALLSVWRCIPCRAHLRASVGLRPVCPGCGSAAQMRELITYDEDGRACVYRGGSRLRAPLLKSA